MFILPSTQCKINLKQNNRKGGVVGKSMGNCISFSLIKATNWSVLEELLFGQTKDLHTLCIHLKFPRKMLLFQSKLLLTCKYSQTACSLKRRGTKDVWYERAGQWKCS